jgi:UDP-2,3-diacylglucosamine hydrolase
MKHTLFISDLHLDPTSPQQIKWFLNFCETQAIKADALYILGDFFEAYLGDDEKSEFHSTLIEALKNLTSHLPVYFMRGNRDFLVGKKFLKQTGCQLLIDPIVIDLYGCPALLMHGDTLCTDDIDYLRFRTRTQNVFYQKLVLACPLFIRRKMAQGLRKRSKKHTSSVKKEIMDTNPQEIRRVMKEHHVSLLIHGHTHRPCMEYFELEGKKACKIVLSDWHNKGNFLICREDGERELQYF